MASSRPARSGRYRWLLPALTLGAAALLGGCVAYPADYGYNYGYDYAPAPYYGYGYAPGPYVAFGVGGDWDGGWRGGHDWRGDHDWRGGHWGHGDGDHH